MRECIAMHYVEKEKHVVEMQYVVKMKDLVMIATEETK